MRPFVYFVFFSSISYIAYAGVTEEQMKKSAEMVRNVCQPKFKLADDVINAMSSGNFPDDKQSKCFVHCVMENMNLMRKNKVNYDAAMKTFDTLLPDSMKDDFKNSLTQCKDAGGSEKNPCEVAHKLVLCSYKTNPQFSFV